MLVGREADPPYERPPLSKAYLSGGASRADAAFADSSFWEQQQVELLTRTSVMKLDAAGRVAKLSSKQTVSFGSALIATGAGVRRLRADGSDLDGIHYLRSFGNADAIRADAADAERIVAIGGSYIGCEVAATLAAGGRRCTILMQEQLPLERHFGEEVGRFVGGLLADRGIELVGGDELGHFEGSGERVGAVVTASGRRLPCDCVVVGAGVTPDTMLARGAGLELGERGGIACAATLETSVPGIFAAGDVAEYDTEGGRVRVEHHEAAAAQGRTAARNMLGEGVAHVEVPYFWSDIADWVTLEHVGTGDGERVVRGSVEEGSFAVFWVAEGRLVRALAAARPGEIDAARRLIRAGAPVDRAALADPDFDLAAAG